MVDNAKDGPKIGEKYVNDEHQAKEEVSHVIGVPNMIFKVLYHPAERIQNPFEEEDLYDNDKIEDLEDVHDPGFFLFHP